VVLTRSNDGFHEFSGSRWATVSEAPRNGPTEETNGIEITLFDDEASVTVPFWHQGAAARRVFEEI
jgi:hypothetical protein